MAHHAKNNDISIHALLAESDLRAWTLNINGPIFLSTLSLRRATIIHIMFNDGAVISIHALLAESDKLYNDSRTGKNNFYPRSPCGERRKQITPRQITRRISIHALLAESDQEITADNVVKVLFLSTLSLRRATALRCSPAKVSVISIHALLAESDITVNGDMI